MLTKEDNEVLTRVGPVPAAHDGRFARGTVETWLAIQESARQRCEIVLR